ncbi:MAG TPA: AI-2E family transporter [Firmicutes bacterium]|jgi:predicted PurR-regulated permease PerM|nr:AI-2E family transporter [Bacillota bacterium]
MTEKKRFGRDIADYIKEAVYILQTYFTGRLKISFLLGVVCYIVLYLLEIRLKGLLSIIVAVANLLPYLGPVIGMILSALIVVFQEPILAVWVTLLNLGLQLLDSFVFSPVILGKSLGLPPLIVLAVALIGGAFFNIWGVVFAVPVAAIINLLLKKATKK